MPLDSKKLIPVRTRKYLNKDFNSLRADLLEYVRTYYADRIKDFSEASLGGMFLDLAAYVGDVNSFYLDHQFSELNIDTAVEQINIERHLNSAGVRITGAAPAVVDVTCYIEVPAELVGSTYIPSPISLPVIEQGSVFTSNGNIGFELSEDIDFSETDVNGALKATVSLASQNADNSPATFILAKKETCISGRRTTQAFTIGSTAVPFRSITLSNESVTDVISVIDSDGNEYYEVESLVQDTVFRAVDNATADRSFAKDSLRIIPAPRRFTKRMSLGSRLTTLQFGPGSATTLDNDILPDASKFAVPLYGKRTFSRFTLDPTQLLSTRTLGISPVNTTLTIDYRYGGGLSHNVSAGAIRTVSDLRISFPRAPSTALAASVRASLDVENLENAAGGEDAPSIDDLKLRVPAFRNSQSRIVTKEDLIARVYTLPSNFGRVFRAGLQPDPVNPLSTRLYIISRDDERKLIISPDSLKINLRTYLNQFRLISEAVDILDAKVLNVRIVFSVVVDPIAHPKSVLRNVTAKLRAYFDIDNWQIDQPIVLDDINNLIFNTSGVVAVTDLSVQNVAGNVSNHQYSDVRFDIRSATRKRMVLTSPGSIFEIRYPDIDIIGSIT